MRFFIFTIIFALFINGCGVLSLGKNETVYEELGWDYSDAGVPTSPIWVIHNQKTAHKEAYKDISNE